MTNSIYITTTERRCGKSLVSLGIMDLLLRKTGRVGVFRPIINSSYPDKPDKNIELLINHFGLNINYEDTYAFLEHESAHLVGQGRTDEIIETVIQKYKTVEEQFDFVLIIGSDFESEDSAFEVDLNAQIAKNLGAPVLIVSRGDRRKLSDVENAVHVAYEAFHQAGCEIVGVIVNRTEPDALEAVQALLPEGLDNNSTFVAAIPSDERLSSPTMSEIAEQLDAEVLYGETHLDNLAYNYLTVSMTIRNYLPRLKKNSLLVTAGDRNDVLLSAVQAHQSSNYPRLSGIILSGDMRPPESVACLIEGLTDIVPILSVKPGTFDTTASIVGIRSHITPENKKKIELSVKLFDRYIDIALLENILGRVQVRGLTPKMFIYNLVQKAKSKKQRIVLPEAADERILRAADQLLGRDVVDLIFLGDPNIIEGDIQRLGLQNIDPAKHPIIDPQTSERLDEYADALYDLRKHKGVTRERARDAIVDVSYFGTMMVFKGHADGMVSGAQHTTAHTILPSLQFVKTKPGVSVVSSVFFMALADRVLVYGDCAVNPNPSAEDLAEIAIASADTARTFGVEPRVAMLSYSTGTSGTGEEVEKVRKATALAQARRPDLILEGPMQYDAAVSRTVAAQKMPESQVAGRATVFIFPDLNTGNNTYKAVQRETGAIAIGPVLQGLNKPVNDLSRGCTVQDIVNTIAITAIQAQSG